MFISSLMKIHQIVPAILEGGHENTGMTPQACLSEQEKNGVLFSFQQRISKRRSLSVEL